MAPPRRSKNQRKLDERKRFEGRLVYMTQRMRWSVMWMKGDEIKSVAYGADLMEALKTYTMLKKAGRKFATLYCNTAFPPPLKYQVHEYFAVEERKVFRKGRVKKVKVKVRKTRNRMLSMNRKGWWWCCYCISMRKFELHKGRETEEGRWIEYRKPRMHCPICGVSTRDSNIRQANPLAAQIEAGEYT